MQKETNPNFIFFGTPYVARDTLSILIKHGLRPKLVVTNPDQPKGRGLVLTPSDTRKFAEEHNIPTFTPKVLDQEAIDTIRTYGADVAIVVAYGKIFPASLIEIFPKGVINVHYSLLPKYRGAAPVEAALLNNDEITGVSIQKMAVKLDCGDVLALRSIHINPHETTRELRQRLVTLGADLLVDFYPTMTSGVLDGAKQEESLATYAPKIKKEDGAISFGDDDEKNWNKYRAYAEWPGTYFFAERGGKLARVKIVSAYYDNGKFSIERVIPEGKRAQLYDVFLAAGWKPKD